MPLNIRALRRKCGWDELGVSFIDNGKKFKMDSMRDGAAGDGRSRNARVCFCVFAFGVDYPYCYLSH